MKKILITLFLFLQLCNLGFAESYYFKGCKLNANTSGDYLIDFDNNSIIVNLKATDGSSQKLVDKIKLITKDQIFSEKIQSRTGKDNYFTYYLDANSKSVVKQKYKKEKGGIGLIILDGPKKQSYCTKVKADWEKKNKEAELKRIEEEKRQAELESEKKRKKLEKKKKKALEEIEKNKNIHSILITGKKWIKFSEFTTTSGENLKIDFNKKASELCSLTGNFDIIEQKVEVLEIDDTPAFGLETVIKLGINGVIECK